MKYDYDRPKDTAGEPSLAEMTEKTIDILARNPEGFLLMIEGAASTTRATRATPTARCPTASP